MNYVANQWEDGEKLDLEKYENIEQGIVNVDIEKENLENKITFIDENSTDIEYPSARAIWLRYRQIIGFPEPFPINWFDSDKETLLYANTGLYGSWPVYDNPEEPDVSANDFLKFDGSSIEIVSRTMDYRKKDFWELLINFPEVKYDYIALQTGLLTKYNKERDFGKIEYLNVNEIGEEAFNSKLELLAISFPLCVTIGSAAFTWCTSLSTANFPICISINRNAFATCSSLLAINFPKCEIINIDAFYACSNLSAINFPSCIKIGFRAFEECLALSAANFPICKIIEEEAFCSCFSLSRINFPKCEEIGKSAFEQCRTLISINFPLCKKIGSSAFAGCYFLSDVKFPICKIIEGNAFAYCKSLSTISFPKCEEIGPYVFTRCSLLESIYLLSSSITHLITSNAFIGTPVENSRILSSLRYGSIYVPESLVEAYKTAENWSYYADRITAYK